MRGLWARGHPELKLPSFLLFLLHLAFGRRPFTGAGHCAVPRRARACSPFRRQLAASNPSPCMPLKLPTSIPAACLTRILASPLPTQLPELHKTRGQHNQDDLSVLDQSCGGFVRPRAVYSTMPIRCYMRTRMGLMHAVADISSRKRLRGWCRSSRSY